MRISVSCARCRQAKVKCIHDGSPPCRACARTQRAACQLTSTQTKALVGGEMRQRRSRRKRPSHTLPSHREQGIDNHHDNVVPSSITVASEPQEPHVDDCVKNLSPAVIIRACILFKKKYPGTDFIHLPSISAAAYAENSPGIDPVFSAALLTLCRRFMPDKDLSQSEVYASYVHQKLREAIFETPSIYTVQSLVMLSFYEFGEGRGYKAWMYIGMARRMLETIQYGTAQESNRNADEAQKNTQRLLYNRLYWCCILQEKLIGTGSGERHGTSLSSINVPLPGSNYEYSLNRNPHWTFTMADFCSLARDSADAPGFSMDCSLSLIICGHDNLLKIMNFVRTQEVGQVSSSQVPLMPWMPNSPWYSLHGDLQAWRSIQDPSVRYPMTSVYAHVPFGNGEAFAYINLAFYLSLLFLHRHNIPFFPNNVDHDLEVVSDQNQDVGPNRVEWWSESATQLAQAAEHITNILVSLDRCGEALLTPFAGFCSFSACMINMYLAAFPSMACSTRRAEELSKLNFQFLEQLKGYWSMGESWLTIIREARLQYEIMRRESGPRGDAVRKQCHHLAASSHQYGTIRPSRMGSVRPSDVQSRNDEVENYDSAPAPTSQDIQLLQEQQRLDSPLLDCDIASFDLSEAGLNMNDWNVLWHQWEYYGGN